MKNIHKTSLLVAFMTLLFSFGASEVRASWLSYYTGLGYTCTELFSVYTCTKTTTTYTTETQFSHYTYHANTIDYNTLYGYRNAHYTDVTTPHTTTDTVTFYEPTTTGDGGGADDAGSPFVYFDNMPEGEVTVSFDSKLDRYYPEPLFNHENGWVLNGTEGMVFDEDTDELFYELEIPNITLSRGGMNFTSKKAVIDYLENSDFLDALGFTEREQKNSLAYIVPEFENSEETNYYYLTILNDEAIEDISTLTIEPTPEKVTRTYFAVYPTQVPVQTTGTFVFPELTATETGAFTVKETGELLISSNTFVSFE